MIQEKTIDKSYEKLEDDDISCIMGDSSKGTHLLYLHLNHREEQYHSSRSTDINQLLV